MYITPNSACVDYLCSRWYGHYSSRVCDFWIFEADLSEVAQDYPTTNDKTFEPLRSISSAVVHGCAILSGQYKLHRFRASYAQLQDTPPELLDAHKPLNSIGLVVFLMLSLACFVGRSARLQRMDSKKRDVEQFLAYQNHTISCCNSLLAFLFVLGHMSGAWFLGISCPYGHRVVSGVALLMVAELLQDALLERRVIKHRSALSKPTPRTVRSTHSVHM